MRISIVAVVLACIANNLQADTAIEGPRLGYVRTKSGLRGVMGIIGASRFGDAVAGDLSEPLVLPGSNIAIGINAEGELTRLNLLDGATVNLGLSDIKRIVTSPLGSVVLAVSGDRAYWFSKSGDKLADEALPGNPLSIAVSDNGAFAAITTAETDGETLYRIGQHGSLRLLHAARIPAIAFLPGTGDFMVANDVGTIYRFSNDLQFAQVASVPDVKALAGLPDASRFLAITERAVHSLRFDGGESTSLDCSCLGAVANPLGNATFLVGASDSGPMWVVDASTEALRLAFIPEPVNE